jgi:hypothetical protein
MLHNQVNINPQKIIFLILASDNKINIMDERLQKVTWAEDTPKNIECIWVKGDESTKATLYSSENRRLSVPIREVQENILEKTIAAIEWALENREFDTIIRTNVSSYFALNHLRPDESMLRTTPIAGGFLDVTRIRDFRSQGDWFISGSGIFLNRAACKELKYMDISEFEGIPDDVAISNYLKRIQVPILSIKRCNIQNTGFFLPIPYLRLKSSIHPEVTIDRMKLVNQYFTSKAFQDKLIALCNIYFYEICYFFKKKDRRREISANILPHAKNVLRNFYFRVMFYVG